MKDTPNLHTHVVTLCSLRREGRRGWEGWLKNGVRIKHMITVDYIEFSFLLTYNKLVIYNNFGSNRKKKRPCDYNFIKKSRIVSYTQQGHISVEILEYWTCMFNIYNMYMCTFDVWKAKKNLAKKYLLS